LNIVALFIELKTCCIDLNFHSSQ